MRLSTALLAAISFASAFGQAPPAAQPVIPPGRTHLWWHDPAPGAGRPFSVNNKKLPLIAVKGNHFVDPDGKTILFRGLSIADPDKLQVQGHWNRELFVKAKEMGTTLLRIPVHPVAWRERGGAEYIKVLDQAVEWATDLGMYVIIDWHSIGNLTTGVFQDPMYETSKEETYGFWRAMARHYNGHNTVAFFELFNEPAAFGRVSWDEWKKMVEDEIAIIRDTNRQAIPLVAGFDWAYDLTPLHMSPIAAEGIGYTTHPYAMKRQQPWEPKWEEDFGFAASKYPIIATEFGGFAGTSNEPAVGRTANPAYGPAIIKYLESRGISWTVWCFDPEWGPTLVSDWEFKLNGSGEFAKSAMHGEIK